MNWSQEQLDIFEWFKSGSGHLVVEAFAGTGKTTTIKEAFSHAPEKRILYAVFNKKNQKEAEAKITDYRVEVKTLHALGFYFIKRMWPGAKPDGQVEADRILKVLPAQLHSDKALIASLLKLVGFAKNGYISPTLADLAQICDTQDIDFSSCPVDACGIALKAIESSKVKDPAGRISFDDMVWLPCAMDLAKPIYNLVCVDEAQDMNMPQLTMARKACVAGGRIVVVGDSRQAIYGFRGAVQNGMNMMKITLRASELKLTTTYRCPKSVVALAAQLVPGYKAAAEAPQGKVQAFSDSQLLSSVTPGDAILSRLNAPLMPAALALLRKNIPARIEGRDIGRQLIGMVRTFKAKSVPDLIQRIEKWLEKQVERLAEAKNSEKRIEQARDIAETLKTLALDAESVSDVEQKITNLFEDTDEKSKPAVILSSVHKAKGLEWNRVFVLSTTFRQGKGGEEANIYYVAVTRAKAELFLVGGSYTPPAEEKTSITEAKAVSAPSGPPPRKAKQESPAPVLTHQTIVSLSGVEDYDKELTNDPICKGDTWCRLGEVMNYKGSEFVCIRVSESDSKWKCRTRKKVSYEDTRTGKQVEFETSAKGEMRICPTRSADERRERLSKEDFKDFLSGNARAGMKNTNTNSGDEETNNMKKDKAKTKAVKTEKKGNTLELIVSMAKAGKSEKEITQAVTKEFGAPSPATAYIIGREWRRVNKVGRHFGDGSEKPVAKKGSKAPAKKAAAKAPKTGKPAPPARANKGSVPPPPPRPDTSVSEQVEAAAQDVENLAA